MGLILEIFVIMGVGDSEIVVVMFFCDYVVVGRGNEEIFFICFLFVIMGI